jgi:hypothetical protein
LQGIAAHIVAALLDAFGEGPVLAEELLRLGLGPRLSEALFVVDEAQVSHDGSLVGGLAAGHQIVVGPSLESTSIFRRAGASGEE